MPYILSRLSSCRILLALLASALTGVAFVLLSLGFLIFRRRAGGLMNGRPLHARSQNTTGRTVEVQARATADRRKRG